MPRKTKFILNRHTWNLDQFEFSVSCSYQDCLARLRTLEAELQDDYAKHADGRGIRPMLKLESYDDASSFELVLNNVVVEGTVQRITDETTLIIGLSQFNGSFYVIVIMFIVIGLALAITAFLSAYVSANPDSVWSINTIRSALSAGLIPIVGTLLFYPIFRWEVWRTVNRLVAAVDY